MPEFEEVPLYNGNKLVGVHPAGTCLGPNCAIHNPSDHPLNDAPFEWWEEVRLLNRVCEHGFRHPDPDDLRFKMAMMDWMIVEAATSVHLVEENCDGCCQRVKE